MIFLAVKVLTVRVHSAYKNAFEDDLAFPLIEVLNLFLVLGKSVFCVKAHFKIMPHAVTGGAHNVKILVIRNPAFVRLQILEIIETKINRAVVRLADSIVLIICFLQLVLFCFVYVILLR